MSRMPPDPARDDRLRQGAQGLCQPIGSFQHNKFKIAELVTAIEVAEACVDDCIEAHAQQKLSAVDAAKASGGAPRCRNDVLDECVQLHGGYGFMNEYRVAFVPSAGRPRHQDLGRLQRDQQKELIGRDLGERRCPWRRTPARSPSSPVPRAGIGYGIAERLVADGAPRGDHRAQSGVVGCRGCLLGGRITRSRWRAMPPTTPHQNAARSRRLCSTWQGRSCWSTTRDQPGLRSHYRHDRGVAQDHGVNVIAALSWTQKAIG